MAMNIHFDAEAHRYTVSGRVLPSVTEILSGVGLIDATWYTEESRTLGTYVHEATRLHDLGVLDESSLDERIRPYLDAWKAFREASGFVPFEGWIERPVAAADWAGTLDRIGKYGDQSAATLLDIKTGLPGRWHALQTAAYKCAAQSDLPMPIRRGCVYLRDSGDFRFIEHDDLRDIAVFQAAATTYAWRKNG